MDETILRIKTPDGLEQFAINVESHSRKHAQAARRRAVELRAAAHGATTAVERECLEAIYAYERAESQIRKKKFRASRTWPMVERRGIIPAVEHVVTRRAETAGYRTLIEMGFQDKAFEAVVLRHPGAFSEEAVKASRERLREWGVLDA
ncbi:MAG: hypothetical protein LC791_19755 [Acidobacteria bacterium]|nr:hypothetical protein [Acidobacteriota bacterium]